MKDYLLQSNKYSYSVREYKGSAVSLSIAFPSPALRSFIDFYYQAETTVPENAGNYLNVHAVLLPLDSVEMIFCYNGTKVCFSDKKKNSNSVCNIIGQHNLQNHCNVDDITKINKSFFIRFKPGGFYNLFGIRQHEIKNNLFTAEDILNSEGRKLEDRINNSLSLLERIKAAEDFLSKKLISQYSFNSINTSFNNNRNNVFAAINLMKNTSESVKVREIAKKLNIAERTLYWNFTNYVGLSPKEFIALHRFKETLKSISYKKSIDWKEFIQRYGYYDQSHLINEFKTVVGLSPNLYLQQIGKTFSKCTNIIFFVKPYENSSLKQYTGDLIQAEKIASS